MQNQAKNQAISNKKVKGDFKRANHSWSLRCLWREDEPFASRQMYARN